MRASFSGFRPIGRFLLLTALFAAVAHQTVMAQSIQPPGGPNRCGEGFSAIDLALPGPLTQVERGQIIQTIRPGAEEREAAASSPADDVLVTTLLHYACTELGQRVRPSRIDPLWAIQPPVRDVAAEFDSARRSARLAEWLSSLRSTHPGYRSLLAERRRYIRLADAGGWPRLEVKTPLKAGDRDPGLRQLRARLSIEGIELEPTEAPELFDADLTRALKLFQRRRGLAEDGILGPATREALNVGVEARLGAIEANLERWRWLPHEMPADRIEVDIASATAALYADGSPVLRMRVVVGDPVHRTPMFASLVEAVVVNPPWNVPTSIATKELLPKAARDPGYLARNKFEWRDGRLVQRPGPGNALGRLKFDFPSPFGVYLHDTPGRSAFARPVRALSHGCVRLEKPRELAELLLAPQAWTRDRIDAAIEDGTTRRIAIQRRTPLYLLYRTAFVDEDGALNFRPDIYGWDAKLLLALMETAKIEREDAARPDSECSALAHD